MINFEYIRAFTAKGATEARNKNKSSQFIAGGTNLVDLMKKGITAPERIIDINALPYKNITADSKGILIGALVANSTAAENEIIKAKFPLLAQALNAAASAQLRNMATIGGNILQRTRCSYFYDSTMPCNKRNPGTGCSAIEGYNRMHAIFGASEQCIAVHPSDLCVALSALNATVHISGTKGDERISFEQFHRLPENSPWQDHNLEAGALITGIFIPYHNFNKQYYEKVRDRLSYAFALVSVAVSLEVKENIIQAASLSMGGVAHKPWRLTGVEKFLKGKTTTPEIFAEAANIALEGAKTYSHNAYKIKLGKAAIQEALTKAISG
jgi:xanthine dehydrogenase YagS FAD-binding subunit